MALFESYSRRIDKILAVLKEYGISSVEECKEITLAKAKGSYGRFDEAAKYIDPRVE